MRNFTRLFLKTLMFLFLIVGCGHNIYYVGKLADATEYERRDNMRNSYYDSPYNYYEREAEATHAVDDYQQNPDTVDVTDNRDVEDTYRRQGYDY